MEILAIFLEIIILVEFVVLGVFLFKRRKRQSKNERLKETEIMAKQIRLNNKWDKIDNYVDVLIREDIHIEYEL